MVLCRRPGQAGSVITLICQDFRIAPAVAEAIRLSDQPQARFIIASSLWLSDQAGGTDIDAVLIRLLAGPQTLIADPLACPRAAGVIRCSHTDTRCGASTWGDGGPGWGRTDFV